MLTSEQQKAIEESIWVVNLALKKQNLSYDNDLRQSAILYLCKCVQSFNPAMEVKWSTYAYKNIYFYIKRTHAKQQKKTTSIYEQYTRRKYRDVEEYATEYLEADNLADQMKVREIKAVCTPREREIIDLKLKGYKRIEICKELHISNTSVGKHLKNIETKAREL